MGSPKPDVSIEQQVSIAQRPDVFRANDRRPNVTGHVHRVLHGAHPAFLPGVWRRPKVTVYLGRSAIDWDVCVPFINGYHVKRLANRPLPNYEYSASHKAREQPL
jgi:hypothetical protein